MEKPLVMQTLHHVWQHSDDSNVMWSASVLIFFSAAKSSMKAVWEKQNKYDASQWIVTEEERQKWLTTILRTFHKTVTLFQTSWSLSSREITKTFKQEVWEWNFIIELNMEKHKLNTAMDFFVSVRLVLLVTSASGNYSSPFLSVAPSPDSVVHINVCLCCPLINVPCLYPEHIHLSRLEICNVPKILWFFFFFPPKIVYPIRINYLFSDLPSQNHYWK